MAVTLISNIGTVCFASDLRRVVLNAGDAASVRLSVKAGGSALFENEYFPDANHQVTVYDMDRLVEPCFRGLLMPVTLELCADGAPIAGGPFTVLPCRSALPIPAAQFVDNFFLTTMRGTKDTAIGRTELVSYYNSNGSKFRVVATYLSNLRTATSTFTLDSPAIDTLATVDVSPAKFADESRGKLIAYSVQCGRRRQQFRVLDTLPKADPAFIFRNCFGARETFYMTGTSEQDPTVTRPTVKADGRLLLYDVEMVMSHKSFTGKMRHGQLPLANDLALSKSVFLLNEDGTTGDGVVITDCDLKADNNNELQEVSFTWRRADRCTDRVDSSMPPRLFDSHFTEEFA